MQVVGLLGKLLTGSWMTLFYTSASSEINHVDGISRVKEVIAELRYQVGEPGGTLTRGTDILGRELVMDATLLKLRECPKDQTIFQDMMKACLGTIINVLEKQYQKYIGPTCHCYLGYC